MPPLESMPQVVNAVPGAERAMQMLRFQRGEVAYLRAQEMSSGRTFDLFVPHRIDYRIALGGLMMDGITDDVLSGEYFADSQTYAAHYSEPVIEIQQTLDEYSGKRDGWFKRLLNKI